MRVYFLGSRTKYQAMSDGVINIPFQRTWWPTTKLDENHGFLLSKQGSIPRGTAEELTNSFLAMSPGPVTPRQIKAY